MNVTEETVAALRRMWTFKLFVWGLRCLNVAFLLMVPAYLWPRWFGLPALVLAVAGVVLGIPLRFLAFFRLDVPYIALFMLGLHDALPLFARPQPPAFRNPAGLVANQRTGLLVPAAQPSLAQRPTQPTTQQRTTQQRAAHRAKPTMAAGRSGCRSWASSAGT